MTYLTTYLAPLSVILLVLLPALVPVVISGYHALTRSRRATATPSAAARVVAARDAR
ncbi:hypothetical protein H7J07_19690 [Mycobacterium koreense]|uniref:hypothetical protein n=1 Tax=Mycolicibacillus koreensis TaxID=1069220 RepID=UPI00138CF423|nr:hypothetical protein [Mycolicibacillus koreensis]MCV7250417.1 hypothetical protein [Mycolicibacillus koreensis]BBY56301.1 hypothetical protein MKOR_35520 [Mycolicibacillus koreensis]